MAGQDDHEIRVSACLDEGCDNVILRCSCCQAWELEAGKTIDDLQALAAQHSGRAAPNRRR